MKDPAFLFYAKDFYEGTRTMLPEERACYLDLLIYQHQNGFIPNDLRRLSMYCSGVDEATLEATLEAKFKLCDKGWYNEKLQKVQEERKEFSEKQSQNGLIGQFFKKAKKQLKAAEYRKLVDFTKKRYTNYELASHIKSHESHEATLQAMLKHLEDVDAIANENEDVIKNENKIKGDFSKIEMPWPEDEFSEVWQYWKEYRKELDDFSYKNEKSEQAALTELSNLAEGDMEIAITIIRKAVSRQWKGFFKLEKDGKQKNNRLSQDQLNYLVANKDI